MDSLRINKQMSNLKFVRAMFTSKGMDCVRKAWEAQIAARVAEAREVNDGLRALFLPQHGRRSWFGSAGKEKIIVHALWTRLMVMVAFLTRESGDFRHHQPAMTVTLSDFAELSTLYWLSSPAHPWGQLEEGLKQNWALCVFDRVRRSESHSAALGSAALGGPEITSLGRLASRGPRPEPTGRPHALSPNQCLVAAFAIACARKNRIISRLASGPRASV